MPDTYLCPPMAIPGAELSYRPFLGLLLGALMALSACASGPRYGAAKRKKKGCDCPTWNLVPAPAPGVRAQTPPAPRHDA